MPQPCERRAGAMTDGVFVLSTTSPKTLGVAYCLGSPPEYDVFTYRLQVTLKFVHHLYGSFVK